MQSLNAMIRQLCLFPAFRTRLRSLSRATNTSAAGAGDPAIHSDDPQGEEAEAAAKHADAVNRRKANGEDHMNHQPTSDKVPPFAPSTQLESSELSPPPKPSFQQKRGQSGMPFEDASCVGWDGRPLKGGDSMEEEWGERERDDDQEKMNGEYFEKHKATPLSEVEFADTRTPAGKAWDRAADVVVGAEAVEGMGFVKEDMDVTLARAEAMFRAAKEKGDPNTPWGRVVARKRAESSSTVPV